MELDASTISGDVHRCCAWTSVVLVGTVGSSQWVVPSGSPLVAALCSSNALAMPPSGHAPPSGHSPNYLHAPNYVADAVENAADALQDAADVV